MLSFRRFYSSIVRSVSNMTTTLETLKFDNLALRALPIDTEEENFIRQVLETSQVVGWGEISWVHFHLSHQNFLDRY